MIYGKKNTGRRTRARRFAAIALTAVMLIVSIPMIAAAESVTAFVSASSMTVFSDPELTTPIAVLSKYTIVNVTGINGSVATLQSGGNTGYTGVDSLTTVASVARPAVVNTRAKVHVKANLSSSYKIVAKGTEVNVVAVNGSWALIEKNGVGGYIYTKYLTISEVTPTAVPTATPAPEMTEANFKAYVVTDTADVFISPDSMSTKLGTLKYGATVSVTGYNSEWARLTSNNGEGYAAVASLSRTAPSKTAAPAVTVTAVKTVKVYAKANTASTVLGTLKTGKQVTLLATQGKWACVELNGKRGYCDASALSASAATATATPAPTAASYTATVTETAKVYSKASTSGKALGTMKTGTVVTVIAVSGDWAYIAKDGNYGFCQLSALKSGEVTVTATPAPTSGSVIAAVTTTDVKVYAQADTTSALLGTLKAGKSLNVHAVNGSWAYVDVNGTYGYCLTSGLKRETAQATATPDPMSGYTVETVSATVIDTNAHIYAGASESTKSKAIPFGTGVTVTAYNSSWAYVTVNDVKGFIPTSSLSRTAYTELSKGASGTDVSTLTKALLVMGYLDANVTTSYGDAVVTAVERFQTACGLSVTGTADENTLRALYSGKAPSSPILSSTYTGGNTGAEVKRIQTRLYSLKYLTKTSSVDGDFGSTTASAIRLFQAANGLSTTGHANTDTMRALYSLTAVALPSGKEAPDANPVVSAGNQQNNSTKISSTLASTTSTYSDSYTTRQKLEYVIYLAQNQLGKPYVYGANGTSSYDCTGFTCYCFKKIGISLPRTAQNQGYSTSYTKINNVSDLVRGDLVYFNTISDNDLSDHAGIYLGAGYFIHASSGQGKVVISTLTSGYYNRVFSWGRRVFD